MIHHLLFSILVAMVGTPLQTQGGTGPAASGAEAATVTRLVAAIQALEFRSLRLSSKRRLTIAKAALAAAKQKNVDPFLLIAIARQESDFTGMPRYSPTCFRPGAMACMADCGITQHQVWGRPSWVKRYCTDLITNHTKAFLKSAKEIAAHVQWCTKHSRYAWYRPLWRCVLNRYNQGPFYKRASQCTRRALYDVWMTEAIFQRVSRNCHARAAYWKNVLCFYYGARTGQKMARSCRRCYTLRILTSYFYQLRSNPPPHILPSPTFIYR